MEKANRLPNRVAPNISYRTFVRISKAEIKRGQERQENAYYQEPRYVYSNNKGKVILVITNGVSDEFHVKTSSGKRTIVYIEANVTMRSRMRESRTYGSVRG